MSRPSPLLLAVLVGVLVLVWGTTWAAIRIGLGGVPPFTAAALRFAVSSSLLFLAIPLFRLPFETGRNARRIWLSNGVLLFVVSYGTVYWAEQWVPSGLAAILFATFPLFVAALARVLLPGERTSGRSWAGLLLGLGGITLIYSEDLAALAGERTRTAALVFLLSPVATAVSNVLAKRWGAGLHPVTLTAVPMAIGATSLGAGAAVLEAGAAPRFDAVALACILYLALFGSVLTFGLYFWLLDRYPATKLSFIAYGTPLVAVLVGTVFLAEPMTWRIAAGAACVLSGVALGTRGGRDRS